MRKIIVFAIISILLIIFLIVPLGYRNVDYVKSKSIATATQNRLEIIGYEGYQWGIFGGDVWYIFKRVPSNNVIYHGCFFKRPNGEIHLLKFQAIDAIKP